ncbi:MAG: sugar transferase [Bacilli bacterium]|nr:sugar transferase [Bacilli bacterium]
MKEEVVVEKNGIQFLTLSVVKDYTYRFVKRLFDFIISLISLILLSPFFIIFIIIIRVDSRGPAFLVQKRIGKNGKEFNFYKFRSMVLNADEILFKMLESDSKLKEEYDKNKKLENDPRITKVGKFIRKYSIDELPQLINILKGDMSLIGNRPYLPREKEDMGGYFNEIVKTKPGLTGYWQTQGRSKTDFETRLRLETYYSNHMSLKLDIKIFFRTFAVVIKKEGAK